MGGAIKYALGNLTNFSGRDARQTFWFWVLAVYLASYAVSMAFTVPMMADMFSQIFHGINARQPDPNAVQTQMFGAMADRFPQMLWVGMILVVLKIVLLSASFVRRLHDSGLPGWILALPLVLEVVVLVGMPAQMQAASAMIRQMAGMTPQQLAAMQSNPMQNPALHASNGTAALGLLAVLIVIVLGVRKSNDGPNRYGEAPVRF